MKNWSAHNRLHQIIKQSQVVVAGDEFQSTAISFPSSSEASTPSPPPAPNRTNITASGTTSPRPANSNSAVQPAASSHKWTPGPIIPTQHAPLQGATSSATGSSQAVGGSTSSLVSSFVRQTISKFVGGSNLKNKLHDPKSPATPLGLIGGNSAMRGLPTTTPASNSEARKTPKPPTPFGGYFLCLCILLATGSILYWKTIRPSSVHIHSQSSEGDVLQDMIPVGVKGRVQEGGALEGGLSVKGGGRRFSSNSDFNLLENVKDVKDVDTLKTYIIKLQEALVKQDETIRDLVKRADKAAAGVSGSNATIRHAVPVQQQGQVQGEVRHKEVRPEGQPQA